MEPPEHNTETTALLNGHNLSFSYITDLIQYFEDHPLLPPYKDHFGELGRRTRLLRDILVSADNSHDSSHQQELMRAANAGAVQLFPFLRRLPGHVDSQIPLSDIRSSFKPGSAGIVIPVGNKNIRYAGHLLVSLLRVVGTELPIQIVYAGDDDLSRENRDFLATLAGAAGHARQSSSTSSALEFINILTIFDDSTLRLQEGGWAIKPFAVLGSSFEKVILMDADAVFLKSPDILLQQDAFHRSGALLFRDRLLWQHSYQERHEWYHSQIKRPSATLLTSKVWTEEYAEEADSGVVVVDKSRTDVFMALLHICWQNSYDVREEVTYKLTYGDKETWWMGFELAGSTYEMERHYGSILGWEADFFAARDAETENGSSSKKICSFVIAHLDENDQLLWFNGGLLKNKKVAEMAHDYMEPEILKWAVDGEWQKGADRLIGSCMYNTEIHNLSATEGTVLRNAVMEARKIDVSLNV